MNLIDIPYCPTTARPNSNTTYFKDSYLWKNADIAFNWVNVDFPYLHTHDSGYWEMFIVVEGELTHELNGITYRLSEGDACLIRSSDRHSLMRINDKPVMRIVFGIKDEYFLMLLQCMQSNIYEKLKTAPEDNLHFKVSKHDLNKLVTNLTGIQRYNPQEFDTNIVKTKICFTNVLLALLEKWSNFQTKYPAWLDKLLGELNSMNNFKISHEELAALTPYSYPHMITLFKKYVGETPSEYINKLKMSHAANQLTNTDNSILEIALDCGYDSLSSFNHRFTIYFGVSPSTYRKQQQRNILSPHKKNK